MRRYDHPRSMDHERPTPDGRATDAAHGSRSAGTRPVGRASLTAMALLPALLAALADPGVAVAAALSAVAAARVARTERP